MTPVILRKRGRGAAPLFALAVILGMSGLVRLGDTAGAAIALEAGEPASDPNPGPEVDVTAALAALKERTAALDQREAAISQRMQALEAAEVTIRDQLASLSEAEERLKALMSIAQESAEGDLSQLTSVYENMKPKEAALLFERMSPDFAAGFLGRMRPEAAAAIMSGLPPELGYSISVLLASRNADAAAFATGQ